MLTLMLVRISNTNDKYFIPTYEWHAVLCALLFKTVNDTKLQKIQHSKINFIGFRRNNRKTHSNHSNGKHIFCTHSNEMKMNNMHWVSTNIMLQISQRYQSQAMRSTTLFVFVWFIFIHIALWAMHQLHTNEIFLELIRFYLIEYSEARYFVNIVHTIYK